MVVTMPLSTIQLLLGYVFNPLQIDMNEMCVLQYGH